MNRKVTFINSVIDRWEEKQDRIGLGVVAQRALEYDIETMYEIIRDLELLEEIQAQMRERNHAE